MKKSYYEFHQYNNVILFDGVCNLCNASVDFVIAREHGNNLHFASLQSAYGKSVLEVLTEDTQLDSVVFCKDGHLYSESEAVLQICYFMKWPWSWLTLFRFVPKNKEIRFINGYPKIATDGLVKGISAEQLTRSRTKKF